MRPGSPRLFPRTGEITLDKQRPSTSLATPGFTRGFLRAAELSHIMDHFGAPSWSLDSEGSGPNGERPPPRYSTSGWQAPIALVAEVLGTVGNGKEATVYRCRAAPEAPFDLAAAKIYRAQKFRAFANTSVYRAGDRITDKRAARAIQGKTRVGRLMTHHLWVDREWDTLCALHDAGADVPAPYARTPDAILMEYFGDEAGVAPLLARSEIPRRDATRLFERLVANVELALVCDRVHGDLSAFNVLYIRGCVQIIDFPQAVDPRTNPNARDLLVRDLENLHRYFVRYGVKARPRNLAQDLWSRYRRRKLSF